MQMTHCPNCGTMTGFKRSWGFGTFFAVLFTGGLWLLAIPFYPVRCIRCGLTRGSADDTKYVIAAAGLIVVVLVLLFPHKISENPSMKESATKGAPVVVVPPLGSRSTSSVKRDVSGPTNLALSRTEVEQGDEGCNTVTQHVTMPPGFIATTDYDVAPLEFLFSDNGMDVYSATSYRRTYPLEWIRENGMTVIVFYQDEKVRQRQIASLRKDNSPARLGYPQHFENIKYSMINFFGPSAAFVRDVEYFQPKPCVSSSEEHLAGLLWMHYSDFQLWAMPGLHASKNGPNWITGFYSPYLIVSAKDNPTYVKMHNVMADKVKEYIANNPNP
jgi:hypothetical protein